MMLLHSSMRTNQCYRFIAAHYLMLLCGPWLSLLSLQEATQCLGNIPLTTMARGNTTFPTFVEGELQLTQTLDGPKITPGREP